VILQDDVPLRVCDLTCIPMSRNLTGSQGLLTTNIESLTIATAEGIWTRGKFHTGHTPEVNHLRAEGMVS